MDGMTKLTTPLPLKLMIKEIIDRVRQDPAWGDWCENGSEIKIWVNASSLVTVVLEKDWATLEDTCWLWPTNFTHHINLAKLYAAIKGLNLALQSTHKNPIPYVCTTGYPTSSLAKLGYIPKQWDASVKKAEHNEGTGLRTKVVCRCDAGCIKPELGRQEDLCIPKVTQYGWTCVVGVCCFPWQHES